jgi:hypothetical protein
MKKVLLFVVLVLNGCSTIQPCTKVLRDFYSDAASDNMDMGKNAIEENRMIFGAFNKDKVQVLCLIGTNASFAATKCASGTTHQGVCRYKDGRFMGYSYGEASASDLMQDVK